MKLFLKTLLASSVLAAMSLTSHAQQLEVEVIERADGNLDTCALGQVTGLKTDGDGFLSVRSGPGTDFTKIDELQNHDKVWLFDYNGDWLGVVYGVAEVECRPIEKDRPVAVPGKKGWVHRNWIELLAG